MAISLESIRARADTVMVPMNEVISRSWSSNTRFLATEGLNGCTAVAIVSNQAAVLAHIAPRTPTADGPQNITALMQSVIRHYNTRKSQGLFPVSTTSIILAAVYNGDLALPAQVDTANLVLARLGLPITSKQYRVRERGENRTDGVTSMILHGCNSTDPEIYINDQLIVQETNRHIGGPQVASASEESQQLIRNTTATFSRLTSHGFSDGQATQQLTSHLEQAGQDLQAATNKVRTALALGHLMRQGFSIGDAVSQLVASLVQSGSSTEDARTRIDAALSVR